MPTRQGHSVQVPQADTDRIWQESEVYRSPTAFLLALTGKGFRVPKASGATPEGVM